ncbi:hypothetical protein NB231_12941 [Nitrococcus mobilis Nb-231]|uniref:Uncharacterized protein n=1 Tax=Nitrococcus mobilis Nb-231 TaxID=314278 RepID=A4BVJ8_9GAMM|nr:hypothetical protein NB231_12941 [Nitrococcus mobilis Nb-231]
MEPAFLIANAAEPDPMTGFGTDAQGIDRRRLRPAG